MTNQLETARLLIAAPDTYRARITREPDAIRAAQALRFEVFNVELGEGLAESYISRLDTDPFDAVCDHLLVEHIASGEVVGTYRLQPGATAAANLGYYSEAEFEFHPYESIRSQMVELGRACVHQNHRNLAVLGMLWKGIANYASERGARYLCGCSSITSQDPAVGASAYNSLCRHNLAPIEWRTKPHPQFECAMDELVADAPKIPKLLRAYLGLGAKICGPPALDRDFKTIDFLTLLDLHTIPALVRRRFF